MRINENKWRDFIENQAKGVVGVGEDDFQQSAETK